MICTLCQWFSRDTHQHAIVYFPPSPHKDCFKNSGLSTSFKTLWWLLSHSRWNPKSLAQLPGPHDLDPPPLSDSGPYHTASRVLCFCCLAHLGAQGSPTRHPGSLHSLLPLECSLPNIIFCTSFRSLPNCHLSERPSLITLIELVAPPDVFYLPILLYFIAPETAYLSIIAYHQFPPLLWKFI